MKVFIFRFNSLMLIEIIRRLKRAGVEVLYWEGSKHNFDALSEDVEFKDTIFHNTYDAVRAIPPKNIDMASIDPIDKNLIIKLCRHESQILSMMTGVDYDKTPFLRKRHVYYEYLKYAHGLLKFLKPDVIIFGDVPHIVHQFVFYIVAKILGIKTIFFRLTQVHGRLFFSDDIENYSAFQELFEKYKDKEIFLEDLSKDIRKYYLLQTNLKQDATPFYMEKSYREKLKSTTQFFSKPKKIIGHIRQGTFLITSILYIKSLIRRRRVASLENRTFSGLRMKYEAFKSQRIKNKFKQEYYSLIKPIDFSKKYVYVALHKQPEASTSAMGGVFTDQILMVDILSQSIPEDWVLYVKESVMQWEAPRGELGRYNGYYHDLKMRDNICFVDAELDTFKLIKNAQAVATVTGTVGWESVLRGKPALIFGYIWYMYCDGVFQLEDVSSCQKAIDMIEKGAKPDRNKVLKYLYVLDKLTIRGFPNIRYQKDSGVTVEENIANITKALQEKLLT